MNRVNSKVFFTDVLKSVFFAILFTLVLILVFALIVKIFELGENVIRPVNQVIKVLSIFLGLFFGMKTREKGISKGFSAGVLFTMLSIAIFSFLSLQPIIDSGNLIEILIGAVTGAISGGIVLVIKKTD